MTVEIDKLVEEFEKYDTSQLSSYSGEISTKDENGIFPPYVPRVGKNYNAYKILFYGTAQNVSGIWDSLKKKNRREKVRQLYDAGNFENVWIAPYQVMLGLAGMYIYAKYGEVIKKFSDIDKHIAVSNFYKFSLNEPNRNKDINPIKLGKGYDEYKNINKELAGKELKALKPNIVLCFRGIARLIKSINKKYQTQTVNDPSWILRGGSGVLKKGKSWDRKTNDSKAMKLAEELYLNQIEGKYANKQDAIRIYLLKYFNDWWKTEN